MNAGVAVVVQATCVAIGGRALMIEGPPGSGKSSLALALLDRGAGLIGDDAVSLVRQGNAIIAAPPPNIAGLLEIRGVGIVTVPPAQAATLALILSLGEPVGDRLPEHLVKRVIAGLAIPVLPFVPGALAPAVRAEWALANHGLASSACDPA